MKKKLALAIATAIASTSSLADSGVYTVKSGDTLWDIAGELSGKPWKWESIFKDDPAVHNPGKIVPGYKLKYILEDAKNEVVKVSKVKPVLVATAGDDKDVVSDNLSMDELLELAEEIDSKNTLYDKEIQDAADDLSREISKEPQIKIESVKQSDIDSDIVDNDVNNGEVVVKDVEEPQELVVMSSERIEGVKSYKDESSLKELVEAGSKVKFELKPDAPTVYYVKSGDTLWDIAEMFTGNPYSWVKLWEQNKTIQNPHLIFPKDKITVEIIEGQPVISINDKPLFEVKKPEEVKVMGPKIVKVPKTMTSFRGHDISKLNDFIKNFRFYAPDEVVDVTDVLLEDGTLLATVGDKAFIEGEDLYDTTYEVVDVLEQSFGSKGTLVSITANRVADVEPSKTLGDMKIGQIMNVSDVVKPGMKAMPKKDPIKIENLDVRSIEEQKMGKVSDLLEHDQNSGQYDLVEVEFESIKETVSPGGLVYLSIEERVKGGWLKDLFSKEMTKKQIGEGVVIESFRNKAFVLILNSSDVIKNDVIVSSQKAE